MYTAFKGGGTFVNGNRVHVTDQGNLERALLITGFDQVEHGEPWHKNMVRSLAPRRCAGHAGRQSQVLLVGAHC